MAITDLGRVTPVLQGAYNALTTYEKLDIVTSSGSSYICKQESTGNAPTNTTYWALLAQAGDYAGTATPVCGINLLHNYDFRNAVNQRGISGTFSDVGQYFYDRWMLYDGAAGSVTIGTDYLAISAGTTIEQRIETHLLAGVEVAASVQIEGTVYSCSGTFPTSAGASAVTIYDGATPIGVVTLGYYASYMYFRFMAEGARNVEMVKLEIGSVSTLDRQPPSDYGTELAKCQRFYRRVNNANGAAAWFYGRSGISASGEFYLVIPGPQMRINPTFMKDNVFMVVYNGAYYGATVTSVVSTMYGIVISGTCSTSVPKLMPIVAWANNIVEFSADL